MRNAKWVSLAALAAISVGGLWLYRNRRLFLVRDVTTGENFDYPELRAHVYFADVSTVEAAAADAASTLPKWRLVYHDAENHQVHAEVETSLRSLIGDVIVTVAPLGERHARVVIRACSRLSVGDFGESARQIKHFQDAMDVRLIGG